VFRLARLKGARHVILFKPPSHVSESLVNILEIYCVGIVGDRSTPCIHWLLLSAAQAVACNAG
jgi:hypothetical protein